MPEAFHITGYKTSTFLCSAKEELKELKEKQRLEKKKKNKDETKEGNQNDYWLAELSKKEKTISQTLDLNLHSKEVKEVVKTFLNLNKAVHHKNATVEKAVAELNIDHIVQQLALDHGENTEKLVSALVMHRGFINELANKYKIVVTLVKKLAEKFQKPTGTWATNIYEIYSGIKEDEVEKIKYLIERVLYEAGVEDPIQGNLTLSLSFQPPGRS